MPSSKRSLAERALAELELRRRRHEAAAKPPLTFREFIRLVNPRFQFYRHCEVLIDVLQRVADGQIKRLMVFEPPRHGKSELVSRLFAAYFLHLYPHRWAGICSYGADLAFTLARAAQEYYVTSGGTLKSNASAVRHCETQAGGGMWAAGVCGPILGKGWHLGIIDDPTKSAAEAHSEVKTAALREWFTGTFYNREEPTHDDGDPDGALVIVQQRWSDEDLPGWLLTQEDPDDEPQRWHVVCLEAIKEDEPLKIPATCTLEPDWRQSGEALCPERRPLRKLTQIRRVSGSYTWAALFQQRPRAKEGNKFKRGWFRYWSWAGDGLIRLRSFEPDAPSKLVKLADCRIFGTVDLALSIRKAADFTVLAVWAVTPDADLILLTLYRDKLEDPQIVPKLAELHERHGPGFWAIEANGIGLGIVQQARRAGLPVRGIVQSQDKITRASTAIVRVEAGQVFFPAASIEKPVPWLDAFENELLSFPVASHDDQVDVLSLAADDVFQAGGSPEPDGAREAREAEARKAAEEAHRDPDADHWWS